ncbi:MAG: chemotaxis protein CheA, partial [Deltaproteobacteria bacterium]
KLHQDIGQLARITSELQKTAMALRMVPIRQTFQKMIRLVRDLAKKSGKRVQLQMEGEETEIDRNMVEEIYEPLVHMVRNAIDHGIEPPEERRARGKPEEGTVLLRAYHKGGNIVIEISDDGRGLDREKILKRAREQGLVAEGEELSDKEVLHLIFRPGFSTAEEVTDVSGRGVGMDVVKKAVEKLRGRIEVESTPGEGSTFTLRLPLTLAIIDGMVLRVGDERCILPTLSIQEALKPSKEQCFTVTGKGEMIKVRDELLPLVRLHALFGLPDGRPPWEALVIVAESEGRKKCLLADEVLGKQEVVIKSLGEAFGAVKGVAGGAIMGDGRVGLILDVAGIFKLSEEGELA